MQFSLSDLVPIAEIQSMLDSFQQTSGIAAALLDLNNQVLVTARPREHQRVFLQDLSRPGARGGQAEGRNRAQAARSVPVRHELPGGLFEYRSAIQVEGQDLAVLVLGPVFHSTPDEDRLRQLARESGVDESEYLQEARKAPVMEENQAEAFLELLAGFIQRLAEKGLTEQRLSQGLQAARTRLEKEQQLHDRLEASLRERTGELERVNAALEESERRFRVALVDTPVVVFNQDLDLRYTWIYNPDNYSGQPVTGKTDFDLFAPEDATRLTALKKRVIGAGLLTREEVSISYGRKTKFYDMTLDPLYDSEGEVVGLTCAATDITERKQIEEELRRRLAEIEGIQKIARGLLQKIGLDEVLEIVCAEAMQLTNAQGSAVLLLDEEGWLRLTHQAGAQVYSQDRLPLEGSFAGKAVLTGSHVWIRRQENEPGMELDQEQTAPWPPELYSMLSVPLKMDRQVIGVLNIVNKPGELTGEDLRIISLFADQAAIIIEHVRLQQRAEKFAVLEERQRLARELHDSVTQALYGVTLYADAARLAFSRQQWEALDRNLQEARSMAREAMYDMRLLVFELRPFMLEKDGLVSALRARLAAVEGRSGLKTEVQVEGERRLPAGVEEEIYRIVQEGLNNVVKHARAREVRIFLTYGADSIRLELIDDGSGLNLEKASRNGGVGLQSMQERAERLGGRLIIESAPGKGTRLILTVPIHELNNAQIP